MGNPTLDLLYVSRKRESQTLQSMVAVVVVAVSVLLAAKSVSIQF